MNLTVDAAEGRDQGDHECAGQGQQGGGIVMHTSEMRLSRVE